MGCLEQGNPLISRLGGEGVLCVIGGVGGRDRFWVRVNFGGVVSMRWSLWCAPGATGGELLSGGHLRPHGTHLLGGLL